MTRWQAIFAAVILVGLVAAMLILALDKPVRWTPRRISLELASCLCTSHDEVQRGRCLCDAWKRCDLVGEPPSCAMDQITTGAVDVCGAMPGGVNCP